MSTYRILRHILKPIDLAIGVVVLVCCVDMFRIPRSWPWLCIECVPGTLLTYRMYRCSLCMADMLLTYWEHSYTYTFRDWCLLYRWVFRLLGLGCALPVYGRHATDIPGVQTYLYICVDGCLDRLTFAVHCLQGRHATDILGVQHTCTFWDWCLQWIGVSCVDEYLQHLALAVHSLCMVDMLVMYWEY